MEEITNISKNQLEYGYLYDAKFNQSLQKIAQAKLHGPFLSHVVKFMRQYDKHFVDLKKKYTELAKQYAELDEHGELKQDEKGNFKIKKDMEQKWLEAVNTLMDTRFPIRKIPYQNLINEGVELTPVDISILEPILDGIEDN